MLNKFMLLGNVSREVETRNGVVSFGLAVGRNYKNKETGEYDTDFFDISCFGNTASYVSEKVHKGDKIGIEGHIQKGSYKDNDGATRYVINFICDNVFYKEWRNTQPTTEEAVKQMKQGANSNETFSNPFSTTAPIEINSSDLSF